MAQEIINQIFKTKRDKKTIEDAIYQLAQIFEEQIINSKNNVLLSYNTNRNQLLNSPFNKINQEKNNLLEKAINIYDSLRISTKKIKPQFHLAEIKYKILADYDSSLKLYNNIIQHKNNDFYNQSIERKIDVMISQGKLEKALDFINKNINIKDEDLKINLLIKEIQILYYQNDTENLSSKLDYIMKQNILSHKYYNDILSIMNDVLIFNDDVNFEKYAQAMLKLYQNKRTEALNILEGLVNIDNDQIRDKIIYQYAYLNFLQGNIEKTVLVLNNISFDSGYKEKAILLKAEIYDYIEEDKSKAVDLYLLFLNDYPISIHYESIRMRLRKLAS